MGPKHTLKNVDWTKSSFCRRQSKLRFKGLRDTVFTDNLRSEGGWDARNDGWCVGGFRASGSLLSKSIEWVEGEDAELARQYSEWIGIDRRLRLVLLYGITIPFISWKEMIHLLLCLTMHRQCNSAVRSSHAFAELECCSVVCFHSIDALLHYTSRFALFLCESFSSCHDWAVNMALVCFVVDEFA